MTTEEIMNETLREIRRDKIGQLFRWKLEIVVDDERFMHLAGFDL